MELKDVLVTVNDWLKFAEAKHSVLIGLLGGAFFALLLARDELVGCSFWLSLWVNVVLICMLIAAVISLYSFVPVLDFVVRPGKRKYPVLGNPLYFGDIAYMSTNELMQRFGSDQQTEQHKYVAEQVIVNSRITLRKYKLFTRAIILVLLGIVPPIGIFALVKNISKL